jgi:hypothetical protein
MYDREVDVPRLTAHFRLAGGDPPPAAIVEAARRVASATGEPFNAVGLNLYRDGRDSVAVDLEAGSLRAQDARGGGRADQPGLPRQAGPAGRRRRPLSLRG